MTTRGFVESDFARVAEIVDQAVAITVKVDKKARSEAESQGKKNPGTVKAFLEYIKDGTDVPEILKMKSEVEQWVGTFSEPWLKEDF